MNLDKEIFELALEDILPNRFQPREVFDEQSLNELALSIREHGVIQPIIVRKIGDKYEIVAGERRFRASQIAGKRTIPALVRNIDDKESAKIALLENLQRKNLTSIEEARTYNTILKLDNLTQEELANNLGKSQSAVANKLRLLNLDVVVQDALLNEKISERHARSLLNITNHEQQKELLNKIILNRMTVKQLDEEIAIFTGKQIEDKEENDEKEEDLLFSTENIVKEEQDKVYNPLLKPLISSDTLDISSNKANALLQTNKEEILSKVESTPHQLTVDEILANYNSMLTKKEAKVEQSTAELPIIKNEVESASLPIFNNYEDNQNIQNPSHTVEKVEEKNNFNQVNNLNETISKESLNNNTYTPFSNKKDESKEEVSLEKQIVHPNIYTIDKEEVYDLRFAINNFRQAIQTTQKFGFKVEFEEFDFDKVYQIVIRIDKK